MPRLWNAVYTIIFALSMWLGYVSMTPDKLRRLNPSIASGCVLPFALASIGGILAMRYARSKNACFRLPSWNRRFPFCYWEDPMQAFFGYTLVTFGLLMGGFFRISVSGANGLWEVLWDASSCAGLLVAQVVGYRLYRDAAGMQRTP